MSKILNELKDREKSLIKAIYLEPSDSLYFQDVMLTLDMLRKQIKNLEFAKTNPLVMVS